MGGAWVVLCATAVLGLPLGSGEIHEHIEQLLAGLTSNIFASVEVRNTPTADLVSQLQGLQDSIVKDESDDKVQFKEKIAEMEHKLQTARMIVRSSPGQIGDLQQKVERAWRKANETDVSIARLKSRQSDIEEELELARTAADAHQQKHMAHSGDINKDIGLLEQAFDLLGGICPINAVQHSSAQQHAAVMAMLELSATDAKDDQDVEEDPCTEQHVQNGKEYCNDPTWCGKPLTCASCKYDTFTDHCFTESCEDSMAFVNHACLDLDGCLPASPTSQCCRHVNQYTAAKCSSSVCGTMMSDYAERCKPQKDLTNPSDNGACDVLRSLMEELVTARHHEDSTHQLQISELHQEKHMLEADLQSIVNEVAGLTATRDGLVHKANENNAELELMQMHTVEEAEALVTSLPGGISDERHARQIRKEARQRELVLIATVLNLLREMGEGHEPPPTLPEERASLECHHFDQPGYYFHPDGEQPVAMSCPDDVKCGIEKIVINPLDNPSVYIVRMGCYSDLAKDSDQCGATHCPSTQHMTLVECCAGNLCNGVEGELAMQNPQIGDCNPDPDICACQTSYRDSSMTRPSPFPSKSPLPSVSVSAAPTPKPRESASPSISLSRPPPEPSASPSPSALPVSCETLKSTFPDLESGIYEVTLGSGSTRPVYCDMSSDEGAGYTLVWKNVGGSLKNTTGLKSNQELLSSGSEDVVLPPFSAGRQSKRDVSEFSTSAYEYYTATDNVEWLKLMVLYDGHDSVRHQVVKVVMEGVTMDDVFNTVGKGHCVRTSGQFSLYASGDVSKPNTVDHFMGRTSIVDSGHETGSGSSFGLATQATRCTDVVPSNLIRDVSSLRRLTDDLQLATNEAYGTVNHLFSYYHNAENPRDFSRCMFRCWNDRDGKFHETFVWAARMGCPGFLSVTGERCSGHGTCQGGICTCDAGWSGPGCAARYIAPRCGAQPNLSHGQEECSDNTCVLSCDAGYALSGPASWQCSEQKQWVGPSLSSCDPVCEGNCNQHGECVAPNMCKCDPGWVGDLCTMKSCLEPLSRLRHGSFVCDGSGTTEYRCEASCDEGYTLEGETSVGCNHGAWNTLPSCKPLCPPDDCSRHGLCKDPGICECWEGFKGDACQFPDCPHVAQCNSHGLCVSTDVCLCDEGWDGPQCDLPLRPLNSVALQLTGPDSQAIVLPALGSFDHLTIEFWMFVEKTTLLPGVHMLLENVLPTYGGINVGISDSRLLVRADGVNDVMGVTLISPGWSHVAVQCTPTTIHAVLNSEDGDKGLLSVPMKWELPESRLGGGASSETLPFYGLVKELRVWNSTRTWQDIAGNMFETLAMDSDLVALYPMNGPLSATTAYLDDVTGKHPVRVLGGRWVRAPTPPPDSSLPTVYHSVPVD